MPSGFRQAPPLALIPGRQVYFLDHLYIVMT